MLKASSFYLLGMKSWHVHCMETALARSTYPSALENPHDCHQQWYKYHNAVYWFLSYFKWVFCLCLHICKNLIPTKQSTIWQLATSVIIYFFLTCVPSSYCIHPLFPHAIIQACWIITLVFCIWCMQWYSKVLICVCFWSQYFYLQLFQVVRLLKEVGMA